MQIWLLLLGAIVLEVAGTTSMKSWGWPGSTWPVPVINPRQAHGNTTALT